MKEPGGFKKTALAGKARIYLSKKTERERERLLQKRGMAGAPKRKGRLLQASYRWQDWEMKLPGKFPDKEVARRTGRSLMAVRAKRLKMGMRFGPSPKMKPWQKWEVELLGKISDKEAARRTGRKLAYVGEQRRRLGLNYYHVAKHPRRKWTAQDEVLLGTAVDSVIARRLNTTKEAVKCRRDVKKIPAFRRLHFWTPAEDKIVMGCSFKEAARRLKIPQHNVESRRRALRAGNVGAPARKWTAEEIALLGKHTDTELARKLGRSRGSVSTKRRELHIRAKGNYFRRWTPKEDRLLGTKPDAEIAERLNRTVEGAKRRRIKVGIRYRMANWTPAEDKLPEAHSDEEVVRRTGRKIASVQKR